MWLCALTWSSGRPVARKASYWARISAASWRRTAGRKNQENPALTRRSVNSPVAPTRSGTCSGGSTGRPWTSTTWSPTRKVGRRRARSMASAAAPAPTIRLAAVRMPSRCACSTPWLTATVSPKSSAVTITCLLTTAPAVSPLAPARSRRPQLAGDGTHLPAGPLRHHAPTAADHEAGAAPLDGRAGEGGHGRDHACEVAQRQQQEAARALAVAEAPAHEQPGGEQADGDGGGGDGQSERVAATHRGERQGEGYGADEQRAKQPPGVAGAGVLVPVELVAPPLDRTREVDQHVDEIRHHRDPLAARADAASHLEVLEQVMTEVGEAADGVESRAAHRIAGAEHERRGAGDLREDEVRHPVGVDEELFQRLVPAAGANRFVEGGGAAHRRVSQRRHDRLEVVGTQAHVGVAHHQQIMAGAAQTDQQVARLAVGHRAAAVHDHRDALGTELALDLVEQRQRRLVPIRRAS